MLSRYGASFVLVCLPPTLLLVFGGYGYRLGAVLRLNNLRFRTGRGADVGVSSPLRLALFPGAPERLGAGDRPLSHAAGDGDQVSVDTGTDHAAAA